MKKQLLLILALLPLAVMAQKKDIQKTSFEVDGVCMMCKMRIEKAAFTIKGLKTASWDVSTHQFAVTFDANKVTLEQIHQAIAEVGHDTPLVSAPDKVYENLPMCCLYDRKEKQD
ncbi:MAG: heavy-metal-associated domain-containing protein [Flavobacteriaceae bacterium]